MDHLELFQKLRKNAADCAVDLDRTETSTNYQDDRFCRREIRILETGKSVSFEEFLTNRRSGQDAFPSGRYFKVSGKLQHTHFAEGMQSLFARPGVISDS